MKEELREYTEKEEFAEKLRRKTLERWEAYQIGAEGFDNESIMAWLDSWGTGNETGRT